MELYLFHGLPYRSPYVEGLMRVIGHAARPLRDYCSKVREKVAAKAGTPRAIEAWIIDDTSEKAPSRSGWLDNIAASLASRTIVRLSITNHDASLSRPIGCTAGN